MKATSAYLNRPVRAETEARALYRDIKMPCGHTICVRDNDTGPYTCNHCEAEARPYTMKDKLREEWANGRQV